jgi:hypothetical protein
MNENPAPDDLTENWPDEPDKAGVEGFARELQGSIPQLGDDGMQRIESRLQQEMGRRRRVKRKRNLVAAGALAASLLVGLAIVLWPRDDASVPDIDRKGEPRLEIVRDSYRVPMVMTPAPTPPEQPLIALEANQRLFSN